MAIRHYEENSKQYFKDVVEEIKKDLSGTLLQLLYKPFMSQLKNLSSEYVKYFDVESKKKKSSVRTVQEQFSLDMITIKQLAIQNFTKATSGFVLPSSGWDADLTATLNELEMNIDRKIQELRVKEIDKLAQLAGKVA